MSRQRLCAAAAAVLAAVFCAGAGNAAGSGQNWAVFGRLVNRDYQMEVAYQTALIPDFVCLDNNDRIFAINNSGRTIFQVQENGEFSAVYTSPDAPVSCVGFDSGNNMWFSTGGNQIFRIDAEGNQTLVVANGANRIFRIDSRDRLIAVDYYGTHKDIQVITPDGNVSVLAADMDIKYHIVGPADSVLLLNYLGQVLQIDASGVQTIIAERDSFDAGLAMGPDGTVYVLDGRIQILDLGSGRLQDVQWYSKKYQMAMFNAAFDSMGRMYLYTGNTGLYRVDLQLKTVEQILNSFGSTMAMAVNADGKLFLAYGDNLPEGKSTVYQVDQGALTAVASVPGGMPRGLAASGTDTLYIATDDSAADAYIYSVNLISGKYWKVKKVKHNLDSLVVNPVNGQLWWSIRYDKVYHINAKGDTVYTSVIKNPDDIFLDFGPDGTLYAIIWKFREVQPGPGPHSLYKLGEKSKWVELADMLTNDPGIWWALPAAGLDGSVYAIASIDGSTISPSRSESSFDAVLRLNEAGGMELIGYDFPYDCMAAACDPSTGDILFCHSSGVYRMKTPK